MLVRHDENSTAGLMLVRHNENSTAGLMLVRHNENSTAGLMLVRHNENSTAGLMLARHNENSTAGLIIACSSRWEFYRLVCGFWSYAGSSGRDLWCLVLCSSSGRDLWRLILCMFVRARSVASGVMLFVRTRSVASGVMQFVRTRSVAPGLPGKPAQVQGSAANSSNSAQAAQGIPTPSATTTAAGTPKGVTATQRVRRLAVWDKQVNTTTRSYHITTSVIIAWGRWRRLAKLGCDMHHQKRG